MRLTTALIVGLSAGCSIENPFFMVDDEADGSDGSVGMTGSMGSTGMTDMTGTTGSIVEPTGGETAEGSGSGDASSAPVATDGPSSGAVETDGATGVGTTEGDGSGTGEPVACGNGAIDGEESCDDGDVVRADECENNCRALFVPVESSMAKDGRDVAATDVDGDTLLDLVVALDKPWPGTPDLAIGLGKGDGTFAWTEYSVTGLLGARAALVGRFGGVERPDVVLVPSDGLSNLWLLGNTSVPGLVELLTPAWVMGINNLAYSRGAAEDLDGDGLDDLAFVNTTLSRLYVRRGNGGGFDAQASLGTGMWPIGLVIGTVTPGSKVKEVVVAYADSAELGVFADDGQGKLVAGASLPGCANGADALALGDLDGAGPQDLVVTCDGGDTVMLVGHDGGQAYARTIGPGLPEVAVAGVIDLYGDDGRADVFAVAASAKEVVVSAQAGAEFGAPLVVGLQWKPGPATTGDFTGDGAPDIVVLHPDNGKLTVLVNQGRLPAP